MTKQRHLTYQYKAHIKRRDYSGLDEALRHCATLYNAALEERTQAYRMQRKSVSHPALTIYVIAIVVMQYVAVAEG